MRTFRKNGLKIFSGEYNIDGFEYIILGPLLLLSIAQCCSYTLNSLVSEKDQYYSYTLKWILIFISCLIDCIYIRYTIAGSTLQMIFSNLDHEHTSWLGPSIVMTCTRHALWKPLIKIKWYCSTYNMYLYLHT